MVVLNTIINTNVIKNIVNAASNCGNGFLIESITILNSNCDFYSIRLTGHFYILICIHNHQKNILTHLFDCLSTDPIVTVQSNMCNDEGTFMQVSGRIYDTCPSDGKVLVDSQFVDDISKHYIAWLPDGYCQIHVTNADGSYKIFKLFNYIYETLHGKNIPDGMVLHHINKCRWSNRLCNLELTTQAHNSAAVDRKKEDSTSEYKGVHFSKKEQKWKSAISLNETRPYLGRFDSEYEAGVQYDRAFVAVHKSVNGSNNLLNENEVREILANPETFIPKPKRAKRKLPTGVCTDGSGYRVQIMHEKTRITKCGFWTIEAAVAFRDQTLQRIQDEVMEKLHGTPIVRNADGVAIIKVKVPHKEVYVDAKVSDEDYYNVVQHKWYLLRGRANGGGRIGRMHNFIMQHSNRSSPIDHVNHDPLDNRRENLRIGTCSLNARNKRKRENCSSQYAGVYENKRTGKWRAGIATNYEDKYLGQHDTEEEAAAAYQKEYKILEEKETIRAAKSATVEFQTV